jgi:putative oxidoreductase
MKIAVLIARILLGLMFLVFGLNVYFHFIPMQAIPGDAGTLMGLMFQHGWFSFYGIFYVVGGLLILIGRFVPIGLVLLGPIIVNIWLFHLTFNPSGIGGGVVAALLEIFLIYEYRAHFRDLFVATKKPA